MNIKKYIPEAIKEHYSLIKIQKRFGQKVKSHHVHSTVYLGKEVYIAQNVDLRAKVKIDDYTYVSRGTLIASGTIGKYCSIGYNCQIGIFEHPTNLISTSPYIYRHRSISNAVKPDWSSDDINNLPVIGNDVWIGSNAIVMQGVKIGDGAIIAAGAVVTKDVEPFSIVGGVPAKIIRKRFPDNVIRLFLNFKWWNNSDEWIKYNIDKFVQPQEFIKMMESSGRQY
ncbi:MAG TPA: capsular biosynthesis protein [Desulfotomaculum sp.]|nr:MAG: hypothetical protein JL56_15655 [Desulfotomaculum sp. BICA1-6]HBX22977.1 capsular biosynthesis protein [Desulfotomaculum sp.]